ncbi:MAG: exonuclease SbcCD subunit D, partial [Anaerovoracaceae bacterium]
HIGKRVNEFSMLEDQEYILKKILTIVNEEEPDGVIIAGDVYDKSVPSGEAVALFDEFLVALARRDLQVFLISGNHDSPERIAFGGRIMSAGGVHLSPVYQGAVEPITMEDRHGEVRVYLLPFIKPAHVRAQFPEAEIESYADGVRKAIEEMHIDGAYRNVLVTHQFVAGSERSDSEEVSVGGTDNIPPSVFAEFDYVALGHIHKPQSIGRETLRYCGTPLKYSFSEAGHKKSVTVVELGEKGVVDLRTVALEPKRDLVMHKGKYKELVERDYYKHLNREDYYQITLTDEEDVPDALNKLRVIYPNIMRLAYDNQRTQREQVVGGDTQVEHKTPFQLVREFYALQNNRPMSVEQEALLRQVMEEIWEVVE